MIFPTDTDICGLLNAHGVIPLQHQVRGVVQSIKLLARVLVDFLVVLANRKLSERKISFERSRL